MEPIIEVSALNKSFTVGIQNVEVIKNLDLKVFDQNFLVIFGPSGCGKSTLLHSILGLEKPTAGDVKFKGLSIYGNSTEDKRSLYRKNYIGIVYQQPNWIKSLRVIDNVAFPLVLSGERNEEARIKKAQQMLELVNMAGWSDYFPTELSSGQQQLVALARAMVTDPEIIVADEPTGNLDYESGQLLMKLLSELNSNHKKTILMVTHDLEYLKYAKSGVRMLDGKIVARFEDGEKSKLIKEIISKREQSI